ncbi:MAG: thioredoxin [Bacteroidetes bacterium]|nr:thioredoxin [Bacteroidota bacterium]
MKKILPIGVLLLIISNALAWNPAESETYIPLQDTIIGYFDFEELQNRPYNVWYQTEYDSYSLDTVTLNNELINKLEEVEMIVVIGTWCSDSQRELPRLIKILNYLKYDTQNIIAIGVTRNKKAPNTEVDELNIKYVPTIILKYEGKEIGRIIESPEESLEKDILSIVSSI